MNCLNDGVYMLWLSAIGQIPLKKRLLLLEHFKSAKNIFDASRSDLISSNIISVSNINLILANKELSKSVELAKDLNNRGIKYVHINDVSYPKLLKNIYDPPIVLYYVGKLPKDTDTLVSIVGTRKCSTYGKSVTAKLAQELSKQNIVIVSGLADGIDSVAHTMTLKENGYTIAVLGCPIDECYPKSNQSLLNRIVRSGLIISEYPPNTRTFPANFPIRNRIIAGISEAVIVGEAPIRSGSLITAAKALEYGREVLTVPASIFLKSAEGNNELIKDGAIPVTSYKDVLNSINMEEKIINKKEENENINLSLEESKIYSLFSNDEIDIEFLCKQTNFDIIKIQIILTSLEFKNLITKLPGQKYMKNIHI